MIIVSVIIPCFNAEPWIRETLRSVVEQGIEEIEIIVVDDGSRDRSPYIVEKEFPFACLIKTENEGPSRARNLGTRQSKGEFIQYLDADDLLAPGKLKIQLEALQNSKGDVAYGDWQKLVETTDGKFKKGETFRRKLKNPEIDLFTDFWCPPVAYLFRRTIVEKIDGWNERLPIIQDARFVLDCALHGGGFIYTPGIMGYYRIHSSDSVSRRDAAEFVRDCFKNACEIEKWWREEACLNEERKTALLKVYGHTARASFEKDKETFEKAYEALEKLEPGYLPKEPKHLRLVSKLFGYRFAEILALWYRRCKSFF